MLFIYIYLQYSCHPEPSAAKGKSKDLFFPLSDLNKIIWRRPSLTPRHLSKSSRELLLLPRPCAPRSPSRRSHTSASRFPTPSPPKSRRTAASFYSTSSAASAAARDSPRPPSTRPPSSASHPARGRSSSARP